VEASFDAKSENRLCNTNFHYTRNR